MLYFSNNEKYCEFVQKTTSIESAFKKSNNILKEWILLRPTVELLQKMVAARSL